MKDIHYYKDPEQLKAFIYKQITVVPELQAHPFYSKLIDFIVYERAPIFFKAHKDYEWSHFTQYFNYCIMRPYNNDTISTLYYIHDFIHMLFSYPLQPHNMFFEDFLRVVRYNEYIASNDSEILTYYRIPALRQKTFDHPILYDHLIKEYPQAPTPKILEQIRKKCVLEWYISIQWKRISDQTTSFIQQFKKTNLARSLLWYEQFPVIEYVPKQKTFSRHRYQEQLRDYHIDTSIQHYQKKVLANIQVWLQLLWHKKLPKHFDEIDEYLPLFDNQVIMDTAAQEFHKIYTAMKTKK